MYILSDDQIQKFYSAPRVADDEREEVFFLNDRESEMLRPQEEPVIKIYYILLLGYFKLHPVRVNPDVDDSRGDVEFIRSKYFPDENVEPVNLSANQKYKIYSKIFDAVKIKRYDEEKNLQLREFIGRIVVNHYDVVSLFDEALDWLAIQNVEIPSYRKLQDLVGRAFNEEKKRTVNKVASCLSESTKRSFRSLLKDETAKGMFDNIRYDARDFSVSEIRKEINVFDSLKGIFSEVKSILPELGISSGRVKYYAGLLTGLSLSRLKAKDDAEVNLYFLCFVYFRFTTLVDYLASSLTYQLNVIDKDGKQYANDKILAVKREMDDLVFSAAELLKYYIDDAIGDADSFGTVRHKADKVLSREELQNVILHMTRSKFEKEANFWDYVDTRKAVITKTLRSIALRLDFVDASNKGTLFAQLGRLKEDVECAGQVQWIDNRLFKINKKYLYDSGGNLLPVRAEFAIYNLISERVKRSHWYLQDGASTRPLNDMLVPEARWANEGEEMTRNVNSVALNTDPSELVYKQFEELQEKCKSVPKRIQSGENESVIFETKDGKNSWTIETPKGGKAVNDRLYDTLTRTDISTVIFTAANATGFFDDIRHLTGKKKEGHAMKQFIACLIANGTRQGIYKMADLCEFSHDSLKQFQANFMRVETLRNASDTVANAIEKLKIFERYNLRPGYVHASADGQKLNSRRSTRRSRHSRKYFGQGKGFYANTLLANNVPINVKLDSLNTHESHNLFDLLYNNSTEIVVNGVSTDTHGTNRFNFALLGLSDWAHEPRYANTAKVIDSLFVVRETEEGWTLELREKLDVEAIIEGWDYVRRIIVSLHQKDISQTDLVAKLSRSSLSDHSLKALREYDRLLKAIYILDYINDADLRRYVQTVLNRGEAYHQLQRAFGQVGGSKGFRGKSDLEIDMWYECSRLMANCIIYFNSVILSYLLENHERQGNTQGAENMAHKSPVAWVHIIMGGKYFFDHLQDAPDIQSMVERLLAA